MTSTPAGSTISVAIGGIWFRSRRDMRKNISLLCGVAGSMIFAFGICEMVNRGVTPHALVSGERRLEAEVERAPASGPPGRWQCEQLA